MSTPYAASSPRRPSPWWFVLGAVLVVTAVLLGAMTFGRFLHTLTHADATFFASGRHRVVLPAHERRGLYIPDTGTPRTVCRVLDDSGSPVPLDPPHGDLVVNGFGLRAVFDTGDGHLTIACHGFGAISEARIGTVPTRAAVVRIVVLGVALPALLGLAGLVTLVVTAALRIANRSRVALPGGTRQPPVVS